MGLPIRRGLVALGLALAAVGAGLAAPLAQSTTMPALTPAEIDALADRVVAQLTLDEKIGLLHGDRDPESVGQAGFVGGVPRLGIPALRLSDGPAGVRTGRPATALPAPVALAATFSPELARAYGQTIGQNGRALRQDVMLAPMVNIVRVPQAGRNFETLGEDPLLSSQLVAAEIEGIQHEGLMATVKHFAENNQETARQSVSADVDERTLHEIELPAFEAAVGAHVAAVMASYNKVNGTYASENALLETDILRTAWGFDGFVMSDWGGTHSAGPALMAGLDLEMPGGTHFTKLADAVRAGQVPEAAITRAARRILRQMARFGFLSPGFAAKPLGTIPPTSPTARDIAIAGAVLLKNTGAILPLGPDDFRSLAVIGPTARALLVGGGGSARVPPMHLGSVLDELTASAPADHAITYAVGCDLDGELIPASQLVLTVETGPPAGRPLPETGGAHTTVDFTGARALPARTTATWTGTVTAAEAGDYEFRLQTAGGRATLVVDPPPAGTPPANGRGGRGGGGGASLLPTATGLTNPVTLVHFEAGQSHQLTVTATAGADAPMEGRLAWVPPGWRAKKIAEAAEAARHAHTAVVFAFDEGSEGRDRTSLSLPDGQDALIDAVAAANPRTVVVLNNGAPILMPWVDRVAAILQMWYPGQEGATATADILRGAAAPGGKLPVTFPKRAEDTPTADPARYPGENGHGAYAEGIFVGYRWYDATSVAPLFPFGHGLTYTTFAYSGLTVRPGPTGAEVQVTIRNTGTRAGAEVVQVYVGPPAAPPVPLAAKALAAFARVTLAAGETRSVLLSIPLRSWSYWSAETHAWTVAPGPRTVFVGASSRDIRLTGTATIVAR
jgi:beta-glucosidase